MRYLMTQIQHDRRRHPRALTAALIAITDEFNDESTCVLEDLSASGACVHSDIAIGACTQVTMKSASVIQTGVVKYCTPRDGGFSIGIEFAEGEWPFPIEFPIHWIRAERSC